MYDQMTTPPPPQQQQQQQQQQHHHHPTTRPDTTTTTLGANGTRDAVELRLESQVCFSFISFYFHY
jgi:hypothetical protein